MTFLPLVRRELAVAAREGRTYWSRLIAPGMMFLLFLWLTWMFRGMIGTTLPGNFIFRFLSYAAFGMVLFEGAMRTADALSREKRDETIGLLFLTNLSGWDIVLGKLLSAGTRSFLGLVAAIPVLAVTRLTGGVTWWEIIRASVNLLNTLFLSLCVGLAISAWCKKQNIANGMAAFGVIFFAAAIPGLAETIRDDLEWPNAARVVEWFSPVYSANMAFASARGLSTNYFWVAVSLQTATACLLLWHAAAVIAHSWRIKPPGVRALSWKEKWELWCYGRPELRLSLRRMLLDRNPIFWLTSRDKFASYAQPLFIALAFLIVPIIALIYELDFSGTLGAAITATLILDLLFRIRAASLSSQHFAANRLSGALDLILATPLSIPTIIRGQQLSLRRNFLRPVVVLLLIHLVLFWTFLDWEIHDSQGRIIFISSVVAYTFSFAGDMYFLPWISMWKTMRLQNPHHGPGMALVTTLLLPWFLFGAAVGLLQKLQVRWWQEATPPEVVLLALSIWVCTTLPVAWHARRSLYLHFRTAAADRTNLPSPWFIRLFTKS